MTYEEFMVIVQIISKIVILAVVIYILYGARNTLNFNKRFNHVSTEVRLVNTLGNNIISKLIRCETPNDADIAYYRDKYESIVKVINDYQQNAKWFNSDRFEKQFYKHKLTMLEIDNKSIEELLKRLKTKQDLLK